MTTRRPSIVARQGRDRRPRSRRPVGRPLHRLAVAAAAFLGLLGCRRPDVVSPTPALPLAFIVGAEAQSASPLSYNAYNYDLTTPRFTPDGRLLQVEYASVAPEGSFPILALPVSLGDGDGEVEGAVVIATMVGGGGQPSAAAGFEDEGKDGEKDEKGRGGGTDADAAGDDSAAKSGPGSLAGRRRRRGQSRLVSLPIGPASYRSSSGPSPSIVLGLSGVLSDSVSLLRTASDHVSSYGRAYGLHRMHATTSASLQTSPSSASASSRSAVPGAGSSSPEVARRVALALGEECQVRSFGGGIRPYGSSVLVCGVEGRECCLCVTDAGGGVTVKRLAFGGGEMRLKAESAVVVGGAAGMKSGLKKALEARLGQAEALEKIGDASGDEDTSRPLRSAGPLRRVVEAAVLSLLDCRRQGAAFTATGSSSSSSSYSASMLDEDEIEDAAAHLEVVVVTRGGSHHLDEGHVRRILRQPLLTVRDNQASS